MADNNRFVMHAEGLINLIQDRGLEYVLEAVDDAAKAYVVAIRDGTVLAAGDTSWAFSEAPGAYLFYRINAGVITADPRVLCVNGQDAARSKWEAIAQESDAPVTVLMIGNSHGA